MEKICEKEYCKRKVIGRFNENNLLKLYCGVHGQGLKIVKEHELERGWN